MKKTLAFATFAVTGILVYLLISNKRNWQDLSEENSTHNPKEHHLTNVFSKAKRYASEKE